MTGFSFPPPPPPPPRAAAPPQAQALQNSARGGRGGRGGGARGRGGQNQRGGPRQQHSYSNQSHGYQQNNPQTGPSGYANFQHSYSIPNLQQSVIPPGAYVNPAFQPQPRHHGQYSQTQLPGYQSGGQSQHTGTSPPGQKRTREQAFGGSARSHPMKKPPSAPKVPAAPSVPSFGAPLPLPSKSISLSSSQTTASMKPKPNLFGLTPSSNGTPPISTADESDDDDADIDEEASLAATLNNGPLTIEYNGETLALNSPAEVAEWLSERRRRFPTKVRIEEKKEEVRARMEERKRIQEETRRAAEGAGSASLLARSLGGRRDVARDRGRGKERDDRGKKEVGRGKGNAGESTEGTGANAQEVKGAVPRHATSQDETRRQLEIKMKEIQELQRQLAQSESETTAEGLSSAVAGADAGQSAERQSNTHESMDTEMAEVTSEPPLASSTGVCDASEAALDAESGLARPDSPTAQSQSPPATAPPPPISAPIPIDDEDSSDSAPETASLRPDNLPLQAIPASERKICNTFSKTGDCKFGPKCRFKHVLTASAQAARSAGAGTKEYALARGEREGGSRGGKGGMDEGRGEGRGGGREKGRKTIFQRLVEQEREGEERLALGAIKYLGEIGFFRAPDAGVDVDEDVDEDVDADAGEDI